MIGPGEREQIFLLVLEAQSTACRLRSRRFREQAAKTPIVVTDRTMLNYLAETELNTAVDLEALVERRRG